MDEEQLVVEFVDEAREHFADIEAQLLQIEALGADIDDNLVNTVFRAIHSVKGAAGFLGLQTINRLSHSLENVLGKFRDHKIIPTPYNVDVLLKGADRLRSLIEIVHDSNQEDVTGLVAAIDAVLTEEATEPAEPAEPATATEAVEELVGESATATTKAKTTRRRSTASGKKTTTRKARATTGKQPAKAAAKSSSGRGAKTTAATTAANKAAQPAEEPLSGSAVADQALTTVADASQAVADELDSRAASGGEGKKVAAARNAAKRGSGTPEASIRVGVRVLDRLMNLAGELVLSRNQLLRTIGNSAGRTAALDTIAAGLDQVTTELQETIMQTRMQPIGNVFGKFPRVIRDLSNQLGKQVRLEMDGDDVEVDKTIVEAIADPLTHLIRNSVDHGIERPEVRSQAKKPEEGLVRLRASHQAGKVVIEIIDDGAGMDPAVLRRKAIEKGVLTAEKAESMSNRESLSLIFAPGFSTAAQITDVSGRGVGMDVVRTNIEKLGGSVELDSTLGKGSSIRITLPLTLAIVPSMIVSSAGHRYALPQANIVELVRADGQEKRIEWVSGAEVLRLRGNLIPLVRLSTILEIPSELDSDHNSTQPHQVVVIESGATRFALAVDQVLDSEEIVVKPLGRHLSHLTLLAGATILGDGRVAMILDAAGVAARASLANEVDESEEATNQAVSGELPSDEHRLVLLRVSDHDRFAIPMDVVSRIERVTAEQFDLVGARKALQYRRGTLPLIELDEALTVTEPYQRDHLFVIVFKIFGREVGLVAPELDDIRHCRIEIDGDACDERGVAGITVIDERTTRLLDLYGLCERLRPEWFEEFKKKRPPENRNRVLVCEDSGFFRSFLIRTLREEGFEVFEAEDGERGWELLSEGLEVDLLVTDVEMPRLDGFGLTERVRKLARTANLPVIALTSLADDSSIARGHAVGVTDYQVKMNKPALLSSIGKILGTKGDRAKSA
ncbi:chemotaxis protein CheW [Planctomycetaceae bacterium SH139]